MASGYSAKANLCKIQWRDTFFLVSPGIGFNEFSFVSGAIEDRVIHQGNLAEQTAGLATLAIQVRFSTGC